MGAAPHGAPAAAGGDPVTGDPVPAGREGNGRQPEPEDQLSQVGAVAAVGAAVEGVPGAVSLAPGSVMPSFGGELVLPESQAPGADVGADSVRAGLLQAGPLAAAGVLANGANVVVTVLLARLLTTHGYGVLNQLTATFLIVSMPGSAVIVAVVRRVTAWQGDGSARLTQRWARRVHRQGLDCAGRRRGLTLVFVAAWLARPAGPARRARGRRRAGRRRRLGPALRRPGPPAGPPRLPAAPFNLLVEGGTRTRGHALSGRGGGRRGRGRRWGCSWPRWSPPSTPGCWPTGPGPIDVRARGPAPGRGWLEVQRRRWRAAFGADPHCRPRRPSAATCWPTSASAFVALAMVALLQNVDVIVVGREAPWISGAYAAVSVASKALVFGAIVLGGYLLPEAAIRWRQGGHALRQLAVILLLLAVPAGVLLAMALAAPRLLVESSSTPPNLGAALGLPPLVRAMVLPEYHGDPDHVPAGRGATVDHRPAGGGCGGGHRGGGGRPRGATGHGPGRPRGPGGVGPAAAIGFALVHHRRLRPT